MVAKTLLLKPRHLNKPVDRIARQLMRRRLALAEDLVQRLDEPDVVHQFRVAIRRARSIERSYRPYLSDAVSRKLRERLKAIVQATGAARDTEVQLERLAEQGIDPKPHQQPGLAWLQERLEQRLATEYAELQQHLADRFLLVYKPLATRLKASKEESELSFAEVTGGLLLEAVGEFALNCEQISLHAGEEPLHAARIAGKRLRYLLEPLHEIFAEVPPIIDTLRVLQDLLGEIRDLQLFGIELGKAAEEAGAARTRRLIELSLQLSREDPELVRVRDRDETAGLMALARRLRIRQTDLVAHLHARLQAGAAAELALNVRRLARTCTRAGLSYGTAPTSRLPETESESAREAIMMSAAGNP